VHQPSLLGHSGKWAGSFVSGILWGAAIGAAAALMLAPRSGSALRSDLSATARKLRRRAEHAIDGAAETVGDLAGRGESAMHEVRRAADHVSESVGGRRRETL
jgi:gas vesicle protein